MAENDSMEGKNLAKNEQIKANFEQMIQEAISNMEKMEEQTTIINSDIEGISINIEKKDDKYMLSLLGENIGSVNKDGTLSYNIKGLEGVRDKLANDGRPIAEYKDLGLPDIEYLKELEKEQKEQEEKEHGEQDEEENGDNEKDDEEKPELEEDKEEEEKDKEENKNINERKNLVKLNDKTIKLLCPTARQYGSLYLDTNTYELVGRNKETREIEPIKGLSQILGNNSSKEIHGMEDGQHKHINALRMYQIGNRPNTGFAIARDASEKGNFDVKFIVSRNRSNDIKDFAYVDIPLLGSQRKIGAEETIQKSGEREGIRGQSEQDRIQDENDELNEEIGVPEDVIDSFNQKTQSEIITSLEQFKKMLCEVINEKLDKERPNDGPEGVHGGMAERIVDKMVDENKGYEQSLNETLGKDKKNDERSDDKDYVGYGQTRPH